MCTRAWPPIEISSGPCGVLVLLVLQPEENDGTSSRIQGEPIAVPRYATAGRTIIPKSVSALDCTRFARSLQFTTGLYTVGDEGKGAGVYRVRCMFENRTFSIPLLPPLRFAHRIAHRDFDRASPHPVSPYLTSPLARAQPLVWYAATGTFYFLTRGEKCLRPKKIKSGENAIKTGEFEAEGTARAGRGTVNMASHWSSVLMYARGCGQLCGPSLAVPRARPPGRVTPPRPALFGARHSEHNPGFFII